ncbi:hypothetical protein PTW35_19145 (plasmid) [Photobacterium sp. DA100]|uniref:hypothetical protein n=1 Tax=Photobacterium sp. DA100 TaxID=3027472 RepID=UPI00247905F4|nr:hypothetical protein [Photobacterium sp. DA100]WEM45206.1 hypothetical protein PTW35_19145 [Photobacterium sp. DA100]
MNYLSKSIAITLTTLLITACGGGGSGESKGSNNNNNSENTGSIVTLPATSQDISSSSGHNTSKLNFNTNIIVDSRDNSVSATTKIYNYADHQTGLRVDQSDSIAIFADGQAVTLSEYFSIDMGTQYHFTLPINASSYEFQYTRNGTIVAQGSLDSLPQAFGVSGTVNGDDISISLHKNADHTYEYLLESLTCQYNIDDMTAVVRNIHSRNGEGVLTGDYNKKISTLFDTTLDSLQSEFGTCTVEVDFSSESNSINRVLSSKNISIFSFSTQLAVLKLF